MFLGVFQFINFSSCALERVYDKVNSLQPIQKKGGVCMMARRIILVLGVIAFVVNNAYSMCAIAQHVLCRVVLRLRTVYCQSEHFACSIDMAAG